MKYAIRWLSGSVERGGTVEVIASSRAWPRFWRWRRMRAEVALEIVEMADPRWTAAESFDIWITNPKTGRGAFEKRAVSILYVNGKRVQGETFYEVAAWLRVDQALKSEVWTELPDPTELPEARARLLPGGET